jgi:hypothetical protein
VSVGCPIIRLRKPGALLSAWNVEVGMATRSAAGCGGRVRGRVMAGPEEGGILRAVLSR